MQKFEKILLFLAVIIMTLGFVSCRTTEKNYQEAYAKATADNDRDVTDFEETIYNRYRAQMKDVAVDVNGIKIPAKSIYVKVTKDGGGINEWLKRYCVVVAEFKQLFNAQSMRERFAAASYPRTFLIENGEPYYYVVVDSSEDASKLLEVINKLKEKSPLPIKPGFPYLLYVPGR